MSRVEMPDMLVDTTVGSTSPAYAAGEGIGGVSGSALQWANAPPLAYISDVVVTLETATAAELWLVLYNAAFTAGTDNAAFTEAAADAVKCIGIVTILSTKFQSMGGNVKRATIVDAPLVARCEGGVIYGQLIAQGALTLTAAGITVKLGVYRG